MRAPEVGSTSRGLGISASRLSQGELSSGAGGVSTSSESVFDGLIEAADVGAGAEGGFSAGEEEDAVIGIRVERVQLLIEGGDHLRA